MSHKRWGVARTTLTEVLQRRPGWDEALYELGVCEEARGRAREATEAWDQVKTTSPWAGWIEIRRSLAAMDQGRFEACEALLRSAAARAGTQRAEARWGLVLLLRLEGRVAEARRWLEEGFDQMSDPVITLVRIYRLDHDRYPTEGIRQTLERSGNLSPQDDRVWLGKAHLATLLGRFDEACTWLDRCLQRRPNDLAVWRMRLDWAIAANHPDEARGTLAHLPAAQEPRTRPAMLRAWLAAGQGNTQAERLALQESLDLDPVNLPVLERLAEIEIQAGQKEHASELRRRRAELDRIRKDYEDRLFSDEPDNPAEMAQLAAQLGRRFDSRKWALIGSVPIPSAARDDQEPASPQGFKTLADLLPDIAVATSTRAGDPERSAARDAPFQR